MAIKRRLASELAAMPAFNALAAELAELESHGLKRTRRVLQSPQSARVVVDGKAYVAFCSNDYLGLANHADLISAAQAGIAKYGVGAGASHLILGHTEAHHAFEEAAAKFVNLPRALLFSTGYMANIGVVTALVGRDDAVFADKLNHASLNDAVLLSRATFKRYAHNDLTALEKLLKTTNAKRRLVVSDAVFSMDGDIAHMPALLALCEKYDAWLLLDDAHGFGVLGRDGRGALSHFNLKSSRIIYMATLGKAAGVSGAFVAGDATLIEWLIQRARTYVYTTATPPALAHTLLTSLQLIEKESWRREHLTQLITILRERLQHPRWKLLESHTPIQPLIIGANEDAVRISMQLAERGLLVPAIRPPTVPAGTARLRISLSAAHMAEDVARLADTLNTLQ